MQIERKKNPSYKHQQVFLKKKILHKHVLFLLNYIAFSRVITINRSPDFYFQILSLQKMYMTNVKMPNY